MFLKSYAFVDGLISTYVINAQAALDNAPDSDRLHSQDNYVMD